MAVALLLAAGTADAWPRLKGDQFHQGDVASAAAAAEPVRLLQSDAAVHFQVVSDPALLHFALHADSHALKARVIQLQPCCMFSVLT